MAVLLALVLLAQSAPVDEERLHDLVGKCGSEDIAEREEATRELYAMGEAALPLLEKAAAKARGEVKARLDKVVAELTLPARWTKEILEGDWNQVYQRLDQSIRTKELDREQAVRVISAVILNEDIGTDQRQAVLGLANNHRIRDVWPAVLQLMASEDSPYENYAHYLQRLRPPKEAAEPILKMIPKMQNSNTTSQLLELARNLKPPRAALEACLTAIFEGEDMNLKQNTLGWVQQGRFTVSFRTLLQWWRGQPSLRAYMLREAVLRAPPGDAVDDVLALLETNQAEELALAIEYIGRQRVGAAAAGLAKALEDRPEMKVPILQAFRSLRCEDEVRKWIAGKSGPGPGAAIALAGELNWTALGPDVARALDDADAAVRREAAAAAGPLRMADAAPKLEELLRDPDGGVRRAALLSLGILKRKDATRVVLAHLRSDDADLQAAALECLPLIDAEQALAALTSDEALGRPISRHALAVLIVRGGTAMLHRVMARVGTKLSADELHAQIRLIQAVPNR